MFKKETIITKLESGRAEFALSCAQKACSKNKQIQKEYRSYARRIPQMILTNGLGQTLAFVFSKKKEGNAYDLVYEQMKDYMNSPHVSVIQKPNDKDLIEWVVSLNTHEYRYVEEEILAFLNWLRRFAEGLLEEGEE